MKRKISYVDAENGIFGCLNKGHLTFYYLTRSNIRKYMDFLNVGTYITFEPTNKTKKIARKRCIRVDAVNKIEEIGIRGSKTLYSLTNIRKQIYNVLTSFNNYLFVDFEMSMPPYYKVNDFVAEIIQVGYVLTDQNFKVLKTDCYYIKPTYYKNVSKRTLNFLKLTPTHFNKAKEYNYFYEDFFTLIKKYNPKMVVWGKNDFITLRKSYKINNVKPLTTRNNFINLLQVMKTYYNLYNDLGLANTYKKWVNKEYKQTHNALDDANVMMEIFAVFKKQMEEDLK